jgi:hypothetical protein
LIKRLGYMAQIVYISTNPVMPGVVKIGKTDQADVIGRAKELFTTGVPVPFDCVYACEAFRTCIRG